MSRAQRAVLVATYALLAAVGVMLATIESFLVPLRVFGGVEGLSALLALAGNLAVGLLGGLGTGTAGGAIAPLAGWFVALGVVSTYSPGGDVVLPGSLPVDPGVAHVTPIFMVVGVVAGAVAVVLTRRYTGRVKRPTYRT